jgi:hypothetical protein
MSYFNAIDVSNFPLTGFGELAAESKTPQVQLKFPEGLNTDIGQKLTNNASSTVTTSSGVATVTCAGAASAFSQIRTIDTIRYGPGQGAIFLGTCSFTTGVANSTQVFGVGGDDEGFFFGYNGTAFGVLHRRRGSLEVKKLTITAGATNSGDIDVTLDGTAVTVAVLAGDTIAEVTEKIVAEATAFFNAARGWEVHTDDNISVEFVSLVAENAAGAFSFTDTGTTLVTAAAFSETVAGVAPTETWIPQTSWNGDVLDGTGSANNSSSVEFSVSPTADISLDINNLNVFCIQYQYLGAGSVAFGIEHPNTGMFITVHTIRYAGTSTEATLRNPTLHLTLIAKTESGYSGGALAMKTASMAGFIQGQETKLGVRKSIEATKTTTGTTFVSVLMLHNKLEFDNNINKIKVFPDFLTIASEQTKTVTVDLIVNPTRIDGTVNLQAIDSANSVMEYDTAGTTIVGGDTIVPFTLEGKESKEISLKALELFIRPNDKWVFAISASSGANADVTIGLTWLERV